MPLHIGLSPPVLDLARDLANDLRYAVEVIADAHTKVVVQGTCNVNDLLNAYNVATAAVQKVDTHASTSGLPKAWAIYFGEQSGDLANEWAATRAAMVALTSAIWSVIPRSANGSPLVWSYDTNTGQVSYATMTLTTPQKQTFDSLFSQLIATVS